MTRLIEKIKYPKLLLLLLSIACAYFFMQHHIFEDIAQFLNGHGYVSILIAGFLFSYGFTSPFAVGLFLTVADQTNIFIAAPLAGVTALVSDLIIFKFIRTSFLDEIEKLKVTHVFQRIGEFFHENMGERVKKYVLWTLAGLIIASPLPDEFGVSVLGGFTAIDPRFFAVLSFIFNTLGILGVLALG